MPRCTPAAPALQPRYQITDPATGAVVATYDVAAEVETPLQRATDAFGLWSALPVTERAVALDRLANLFGEQADELAATMRTEMGKQVAEGLAEVAYCQAILRYYAEQGPGLLADQDLPTSLPGEARVQRRPLGPLLGVMPWNYPLYQVVRFLAPNLLVGNTLVVKHAESTPATAEAIEQLVRAAGLPDGAYVNVFATHQQVEQVIGDDRIRGVSFTGSETAGATIAAIAGTHLKKCVLELGGSDAFVVLDATDVDAIADLAWETRIYNNGQACTSNKRMIVHADLYDRFVERLEQRAARAGSEGFAPMASRAAAERIAAQVARAVADGARLVGGVLADGPAAYFSPGVLTGVRPGTPTYHEELFGPVALVHRVTSDAEATRVANDSPYGLGAAVFSTDPDRAAAVAEALEVGMVSVNHVTADGPELPFGGVKRSGFGRELGPLGLNEFVNQRLWHRAS
ncbi:aldehyde dehydrogenase family protein [Nocardioides sp. BGMRC 2183]|nr:aldehyde dehydrogenase family protein [Nocardioides sp. BGMRC 2183]